MIHQIGQGMEEFLGDDPLSLEEADVVDQQHVGRAKLLPKARQRVVPERHREVIGERLRRQQHHVLELRLSPQVAANAFQ